MDLARLGIKVDPSDAKRGAKQVEEALEDVGREADQMQDKVDRSARGVGRSLEETGRKTDRVGGSAREASGQFGRFAQSAAGAGGAAFGMAAGTTAASGAAAGLTAALAPLLTLLAPILTLATAVGAIFAGWQAWSAGSDVAATFGRAEIALEALTDEAKDVDMLLNSIRETVRMTGGDIGANAQNIQKFLALGFTPQEAVTLNENILDIAGSVGLSAERANELGTALAQVKAIGTVQMEELRGQIAEKGIPIIAELANQLGVAEGELIDLVSTGKVPADELLDIFLELEGSFARFEGGAERMGETWGGMTSRIGTEWQLLLGDFAEPVQDALRPILTDLLNMLQVANDSGFARDLGESISNTIQTLYEAVSSDRLGELLGWTFVAGVEILVQEMIAQISGVIAYLDAELRAVYEFTGTALGEFLGQASEDGANMMQDAYEKVLTALAPKINKLLTPLTSAADELGLGDIQTIGPIIPAEDIEMFEPSNMTYQEAREKTGAADGAGSFIDYYRGAVQDTFGTPAQDRAAEISSDLLTQARAGNEGFADEPADEAQKTDPTEDPTGTGTGDGKSGADEAIEEAEKVQGNLESLLSQWGDVQQQIDDGLANLARSFSQNLTGALTDFITGAKSAEDAFRQFANAMVESIIQIVVEMTIQLAIAQALAALGYTGTSFGSVALGSAASAGASAGTAHSGGSPSTGSLPTSGLPSYHTGGMSSNEQVVKVERDESILTRRRAGEIERRLSERDSGDRSEGRSDDGQPLQILNVTSPEAVYDAIAANPDIVVNQISRRLPAVRDMVMRGQKR